MEIGRQKKLARKWGQRARDNWSEVTRLRARVAELEEVKAKYDALVDPAGRVDKLQLFNETRSANHKILKTLREQLKVLGDDISTFSRVGRAAITDFGMSAADVADFFTNDNLYMPIIEDDKTLSGLTGIEQLEAVLLEISRYYAYYQEVDGV
jgi:hypothetical protein